MQLTAHAYVARGGVSAVDVALGLLKKAGVEIVGNPDVYARVYTAFSIDDARDLRERAALRAVGEHGRWFVVVAPTVAPDAQNALLKTFEEPPAGARFILIVPSPEALLPTLRSRVQTLELEGMSTSSIDIQKFLAAVPEKRLDMLKSLLEKEDDRRDLSGTIAFLSALERTLGEKIETSAGAREGLRAVYRARKYIAQKGAAAKVLLEQMALLTSGK